MIDVTGGYEIMPAQWSSLHGHAKYSTAEHHLWFRVLEQATADYRNYKNSVIPRRRRLFREVYEWLFDDDKVEPGSFLFACEVFDINPAGVRAGLLAGRQFLFARRQTVISHKVRLHAERRRA